MVTGAEIEVADSIETGSQIVQLAVRTTRAGAQANGRRLKIEAAAEMEVVMEVRDFG